MSAPIYNHTEQQASSPARRSVRREERGVALLLTIFGLLLLTALAAAMMYSSDSETAIAVNYREKEVSSYAAQSGLLEARDRIQPVFGDLAIAGYVPSAPPAAANGGVFYLINPGPGETVASIAPWQAVINGQPNPYFDKELCQENMTALGLAAGTVGKACTAVPAGACTQVGGVPGGWCTYYDESANATNWRLQNALANPIPLDYKWVRITLKTDKSGLVYIQDTVPANGTQVCWDGTGHQVQKPAAAGTDCMGGVSGAAVNSLTLTGSGSLYSTSTPPTVTLTGGGGSGATATLNLSTTPGGISSGSVSNGGSGYTSAPSVTLVSPDGTGAALTAQVTGAPITALSIPSTNYCYPLGTSGESVSITPSNPGTGSVATATVTMTTQACVSAATATAACGVGKKNQTLTINSVPGGTGAGFSGTITLDNKGKYSGAVNIANVGSYSAVPGSSQIVTITGCPVTVSYAGGIRASVALNTGGQYLTAPTATLSGPTPKAPNATQPTVNATWSSAGVPNFGRVSAVLVSTAGSGYSQASYTLQFSGGGGGSAAGTATSNAVTKVSGLNLTNGGAGYTSAPTVVIADPRCAPPVGTGSGVPGTSCGAGASGSAVLAGGQPRDLGAVYMLTSMAATRNGRGSQAMTQMEAAVRLPWRFKLGGALTLAGPSPVFQTPNSNNYVIDGTDANSCGEPVIPRPSIGVWDDPANPTSPTAVSEVINALGKPQNYIGQNSAPDIENVFNSIDTSPSQLDALVTDLSGQPGAVNLSGNVSSIPATTTNSITVVDGNLTLSGSPVGNGILIVTGTLTLSGNFNWNGLVLIIGQGQVIHNGGGNLVINGAMYVAQTKDPSGNELSYLGQPNWTWNGGGGNSLIYDHCMADNLLNKYPPSKNTNPLQILSSRVLEF